MSFSVASGTLYNHNVHRRSGMNVNVPATATSNLTTLLWETAVTTDILRNNNGSGGGGGDSRRRRRAKAVGTWVLHLLHAYPVESGDNDNGSSAVWRSSLRLAIAGAVRCMYTLAPLTTPMTILYSTQWTRGNNGSNGSNSGGGRGGGGGGGKSSFHETERLIGMVMLSTLCLNTTSNTTDRTNRSNQHLFGHALHCALHVLVRVATNNTNGGGGGGGGGGDTDVFTVHEILRSASCLILHVLRYLEEQQDQQDEQDQQDREHQTQHSHQTEGNKKRILTMLINCSRKKNTLPLSEIKEMVFSIIQLVTDLSPSLSYVAVSIAVEFMALPSSKASSSATTTTTTATTTTTTTTTTNAETTTSLVLANMFLNVLSSSAKNEGPPREEEEENVIRYSGTQICVKLLALLDHSVANYIHYVSKETPTTTTTTTTTTATATTTAASAFCLSCSVLSIRGMTCLFPLSTAHSYLHTPTVLVTQVFWTNVSLLKPTLPVLYSIGLQALYHYLQHLRLDVEVHADVLLATAPPPPPATTTTTTTTTTTAAALMTATAANANTTFSGLLRLSSYGVGLKNNSYYARSIMVDCLLALPSLNHIVFPTMISLGKKMLYVVCHVSPWCCSLVKEAAGDEASHKSVTEKKGTHFEHMIDVLIQVSRSCHVPEMECLFRERLCLYNKEKSISDALRKVGSGNKR